MSESVEFSSREVCSYVGATMVIFMLINRVAAYLLPRHSQYLAKHANLWRFKNTLISWIHSLLASCLVIANIIKTPDIFDDMINMSTKLAYVTICVSTGYFLYDALDLLVSNKKLSTQSMEVLLHHFVIISIFWVPLFTNQFVGYTLAALSIEFNTVFLHMRFMLVFFNFEKSSPQYRLVSIVNMVTFVMFRIMTLCWMTRWIVLNRHQVHVGWFSLGSAGLAVMMIINILLLQRLMQSDFKSHNINNNNISKEKNTQPSDMANDKQAHLHSN